MRPSVSFVCQELGAMFAFEEELGLKTYDFSTSQWRDPNQANWLGYGHVYMNMDTPIDPYAESTVEKIRAALKEYLVKDYRKILKSVDDGYLVIGYYSHGIRNEIHDNVGYLHSSQPIHLHQTFRRRAKDIPPSWFPLKAFR